MLEGDGAEWTSKFLTISHSCLFPTSVHLAANNLVYKTSAIFHPYKCTVPEVLVSVTRVQHKVEMVEGDNILQMILHSLKIEGQNKADRYFYFNTCTVHSLLFVIQPTKAQV